MTMNFVTNSRKAFLAGIALTACLGFALNAQAQTCTAANWAGGVTGSPTVGKQDGDNRRYGGPCGMRVPLNGNPHYVTDSSPAAETSYITRFYTFLDNAGGDEVLLFAANDGNDDQIQVWYNLPGAGDLTLRVFDNNSTPTDLTESVGNGWHSVEVDWDAAAPSDIRFSVDGGADLTATPDTSGLTIENAFLGSVDGTAAGGGTVDFDDFDSRREQRPGRLVVGDADANGSVGIGDAVALLNELNDLGFAAGQPDCDENGSIGIGDAVCLLTLLNQ